MEEIKIKGTDQMYKIIEIRPMTDAVLRIVFYDSVPATWGDITLYTAGGEEATTLSGYDTVYRDEGQTVYLSNDGSVYHTPEAPEAPLEPPEPYIPTLEEQREIKRWEISADCERAIYKGVTVTLADGVREHFALTEKDQLNLFGKQIQLGAGQTEIEYHADGQPCRYYTAVDMQAIIRAAMWHVSYHTTYCNALNMWIAGVETAKELQEIFYGADVPPEYQSNVLQSYLAENAVLVGGDGNVADTA